MSFKIGFTSKEENNTAVSTWTVEPTKVEAVKSVVRVYFPSRELTCSYYNDLFDLHVGDLVYVEGKLEGCLGRVADVTYTFKIKLSEYKRVIWLVDTNVKGEFYQAGSHFVTSDNKALPFEKAITWFKSPENDEEEYAVGHDNSHFRLGDLSGMKITKEIADRGHDYYIGNKVAYLELSNGHGRAVVEGSENYLVEFDYSNGEIRNLTCSCFCSYTCKHEVATMLQFKELIDLIEEDYKFINIENGYFAAITKAIFFTFVIDGKEKGKFVLG